MPSSFSEVSAYIKFSSPAGLMEAITALFGREGMVRTERPERHLHQAPALQNNRWAVHLLTGKNGWHLLRATPWSLWCDRAETASEGRLAALSRLLASPAFLICIQDYPVPCGEVLLELDGKGESVASGFWCAEDALDAEVDHLFFGQRLPDGAIAISPRSRALQTLWQESLDLWKTNQNPDYDDCRGDSETERFCHYVARRLLGYKAWDVMDTSDWSVEAHHTMYFEWPAGDRPEPQTPEPWPEPEAYYPDGQRVLSGDAVVFEMGVGSGRTVDFLRHSSDGTVAMVIVETGDIGKNCFSIDESSRVVGALQLAERATADHAAAAVHFLAGRVEAGDPNAMFGYGVRLVKGIGVPEEGRRGYDMLTQAADLGHKDAQYFVGMLSKDRAKAARYWTMAAEQGVVEAQIRLGAAYQTGTGVDADMRQAGRWYNCAASQGNKAALYNLGHVWIGSLAHTTDEDAGADWFRERAESGDAPAQWIMGLCSEDGSCGVVRSLEEAVRYYRMGAEQNYGPALCNLADKYEHGNGVEQDLEQALALYRRAAILKVAAASFSLGNMYKDGRGVAQDIVEAARWFRLAADQGWADAEVALLEISGLLPQQEECPAQAESIPAYYGGSEESTGVSIGFFLKAILFMLMGMVLIFWLL